MKHLFDNIKSFPSLRPATYSASTTGQDYVDTQGYDDGMLVVSAAAIGTTTGDTYTIQVLECDTTNGTYATASGVAVTFTASDDNEVHSARIANLNTTRKRYLRADITCSATTASFIGSAQIILGGNASNPVDNSY